MENNKLKFCKDCQNMIPSDSPCNQDQCKATVFEYWDLIHGTKIITEPRSCYSMRYGYGRCGQSGELFKPLENKEKINE